MTLGSTGPIDPSSMAGGGDFYLAKSGDFYLAIDNEERSRPTCIPSVSV